MYYVLNEWFLNESLSSQMSYDEKFKFYQYFFQYYMFC